jgi:hypothetical protein
MGVNGGLRLVSVGLIAMMFLGFPGRIYGSVRLGPLSITPYVNFAGTFTDNVFLTDTNEKSDFYYSILPGVKISARPIGRHDFYLNYDADFSQFDTFTEANYGVHSLDTGINLNLPRGFGLKVGDKLIYGADPPDFEGDDTAPYLNNLARIEASSAFLDRFEVGVRYNYELRDYEHSADEIDNFRAHTVGGIVRVRILRRVSGFGEYVYSTTDYQKAIRSTIWDNYANRVNAGIAWDITEKTRGAVRGGYVERVYHRIDRDDESFYASADISHELTSHITLTLRGVHDIFDTSLADNNLTFSTSYTSSQIIAGLQHTYRKFTTNIEGDYIYDRYLYDDLRVGEKRRDNLWRGSVGVNYQMQRWVKLGIKYRYSNLNSNFDAEDYTENLISFFVGLSL